MQALAAFRMSPWRDLSIHSSCEGNLKILARRWDTLTSGCFNRVDGLDIVLPKLTSVVSLDILHYETRDLVLLSSEGGRAVPPNLRVLRLTGSETLRRWRRSGPGSSPTVWPPAPGSLTVNSPLPLAYAYQLIWRSQHTWKGFPDFNEAQLEDLLRSMPALRELQLHGVSATVLSYLESQLTVYISHDDNLPRYLRLLEYLSLHVQGEPNTVSLMPLIRIAAYRSGLLAHPPRKEGFLLQRMLFGSISEQTLQGNEMEILVILTSQWGVDIRLGHLLVKMPRTSLLGRE